MGNIHLYHSWGGGDNVEIGIIRAKVQFSVWI